MSDFNSIQCERLIEEKISRDLAQCKTYLTSIISADMNMLSRMLHHYGLIFSENMFYRTKFEICKLSGDREGIKDLIAVVKKDLNRSK